MATNTVKPPLRLPAGVVHTTEFAVKTVPYLEILYYNGHIQDGKYAILWNDNQWYVSTQVSPALFDWTAPNLPIPAWYEGPFPDMETALATLTLLSDITE